LTHRPALLISAIMLVAAAERRTVAAPDRGAQIASICASCHRLDGGDQGIPSIVGVEPSKLFEKMREFRSKESPSHSMHTLSLSLSDDEITAVTQYLAGRGKEAGSP
jgi:cytochrome c553